MMMTPNCASGDTSSCVKQLGTGFGFDFPSAFERRWHSGDVYVADDGNTQIVRMLAERVTRQLRCVRALAAPSRMPTVLQ